MTPKSAKITSTLNRSLSRLIYPNFRSNRHLLSGNLNASAWHYFTPFPRRNELYFLSVPWI